MSVRPSMRWAVPAACSGDMYLGVPTTMPLAPKPPAPRVRRKPYLVEAEIQGHSGIASSTSCAPLADGTLVSTLGMPSDELIPSLLTISNVFGTGWFAADAANVKRGMTVAIVGDGAVGLLAVLSAKQIGAKRIIAMSHEARQKLAREFGATDIATERGEDAAHKLPSTTMQRHSCNETWIGQKVRFRGLG
jgi:hypothetical protein